MKKYHSLELAIAFFMCTIAFYFGGIYFNFNFQNHFSPLITTVNTQSENLPNAELTYADLTQEKKVIDVLFFYYTEDISDQNKNPSLGTDDVLLPNIKSALGTFTQYVRTASNNNYDVEFNIVSTATTSDSIDEGKPLILGVEKPATINKQSVFSSVMTSLQTFTGQGSKTNYTYIALTKELNNSGNDIMLVYLDYKSYLGMELNEAKQRYNQNTSGVFSLDYSKNTADPTSYSSKATYIGESTPHGTAIENFFLIHSDALTSTLITENDQPDFYNKILSKNTKMMLKMFGLPDLSYVDSGIENTTYAGNHSILSNGTYFATFNPYYAYLLGKEKNPTTGWLSDTFSITQLLKEGDIEFDSLGNQVYYIAPEGFENQAIVIYYVNTTEYNQWTFEESKATPPTDGYVVVARINTKKNLDGSYASATSNFAPFYVFEPSNTNGVLQDRSSTLENARLANVGDVIGFDEIATGETITSPHTGYVSLEKNISGTINYINTTLKFTVKEKNNGIKIKVECNNSDILLPENVAIEQPLYQVQNLSPDVAIYLYNDYITRNGSNIILNKEEYQTQYGINLPSSIEISDMLYVIDYEKTTEENWQNFYFDSLSLWRQQIYNLITTHDFSQLTTLDLYGLRDITSLKFLQEINFNAVQKLCLTGTDLSQGYKTKDESSLSLEYLAVLENLEVLEMNSCQIQDLAFLRSLGSNAKHSKLRQLSVMDNNITDLNPINGEYLSSLAYVNVHNNQISNESLQSQYRSSASNFYNSTALDIGLQRIPYVQFTTQKGNFVFKAWTQSAFTNIVVSSSGNPLMFSNSFDTNDSNATIIYAHDPNGTSTEGNIIAGGIKLFDLEHGKFKLNEIQYFSLMSENLAQNPITRTLPSKILNCYYMEFEYEEEELCQSPSTDEYNAGLNAYDNLNPLLNYNSDHFSTFNIRMDKVGSDLTEQVSSIDISQAGNYELTYTFTFDEDLKTNLFGLSSDYTLGDIVAKKKLKVWEYKKIEFEASETPVANKITNAILYKSLLYISGKDIPGKGKITIKELAGLQDAKLGVENSYTLYNQDFYFYNVTNKHVPSILEKRLNPEDETQKGVLTKLDISSVAQEIIKIQNNINLNEPLPNPLPENSRVSISGIQFMNLLSIEEINLNLLCLDSINEILNDELLPRIRVLNAGANKITSITDIYRLKTLEYIDLSFNLISDPTPLQELTDPSKLRYKGYTTQTLKKVNLSFNQISIKGNSRLDKDGKSIYGAGNNRNQFLIDGTEPENIDGTSFIPQNKIYIVLVQLLSNFDHYGNSSKFEYYYTPALEDANKNQLYKVQYGTGNSSRPGNKTGNFANTANHTDYLTSTGNYSINCTLDNGVAKNNNIPFQELNQILYFTVSKATINTLEESYGSKFPSNLLLHGKTAMSGNIMDYTMLTTEYEEFIRNLTADLSDADKANFFFGARLNDVDLTTSSSYWAYNAYTNKGYNFFDEITNGEPIKIVTSTDDNSKNPNVNNLTVILRYDINFYRSDTRSENDPYAQLEKGEHVDQIVLFLRIKLIYNPIISIEDKNLKEVLLLKLNKPDDITDIYAYDLYNIDELDLSNSGIKTFDIEVGKQDEQVSGFDDMIFNNLVKINLSNNQITNTANAGTSDPLYRLFGNPTIFPTNTADVHKIEYVDLSYNRLKSIVPLEERLFKRPITLNLFGNIIDFENSANLKRLADADFANGAITPCKVFIGIQGLGSGSLQKLISFKKDITSSDDTYAKFVMFNGNFYIGVNDITYSFDGAEVEYRDSNGQLVLSKSDSLYTIYYYKDTYYRENQNYSVYYNFTYEDNINIELNATIIHQKMYFDKFTNEDGEIVEKDTVYKEFHNDYDIDAFTAYNKEILEEDIFIYENGTAEDFILDWELYDDFNQNLNYILYSNKLTGDHPYFQRYSVTHIGSGLVYPRSKRIHIVDSTAPVIQTGSPDSKMKYVVLKGSTYAPYYANKIDKDLVFVDDYDNYFFKDLVNPTVRVTISKDGEVISEVEANWNDTQSGLSINCNNPGKYEIKYVAIDSNGNESEPFIRLVEVYYQPYSYIRLSDFSAMFSAGTTKMTASVYKTEEDVNRNTNPIFYWYVDGKFVGTSFANAETSGNSSISTNIDVYIEGAGTHTVQVFIDMTKESYDENVALGIAGMLASATKSTSVFILMDNNVLKNTLIGVGIVILLIIIIIIIIVAIKRKRESRRNEYSYTIIKHDK